MNKLYYKHDGNKQLGPFTLQELISQNLKREEHLWVEGQDSWKRAIEYEELNDYFKTLPPSFENKVNSPPKFKESEISISTNSNVPKKSRWIVYSLAFLAILTIGALILYIKLQDLERQSIEVQKEIEKNEAVNNEKLLNLRQNWRNYIGKEFLNVKFGFLGGIDDGNLKITNGFNAEIQHLKVTVSYIKDNGDIYKTEDVFFDNIPARGERIQSIPNSERGIKIYSELTGVHIEELGIYE